MNTMEEIIKAEPSDAGCWIDGHWGQYATARLVEIAARRGYVDDKTPDVVDIAARKLAAMQPSDAEDITVEEEEILDGAADEIEEWMNEHIAPEGYSFGWFEGEFFLRAQPQDIWQMLEQPAPAGCEAVQDLYSWSLNFDPGKGPFTLFLDLIGWSEDEMGAAIYSLNGASLGYVELDQLAKALTEYADRPSDVRDYVNQLMEAEANS